ncbi:lamin tail domain-containing protein, partial [Flavitalea sp.]|nr:lamin tail domain-containing protein [Flavitalea sp.]
MIKTLVACILVFLSTGLPTPCQSQIQQSFKHALVITELYPDPDARSAIPASEFIELKNVSGSMINLKGWKISDGTSIGTITTSFELRPDSFLVVCPQAAVVSFSTFGTAIGLTGLPSLNNEEDRISLYDPAGNLVHHVHYYNSWYLNDVKKEGGWTLEMIDPLNFCSGAANWKASEQSKGGTPGFTNSVNRLNPDEQSPAVVKSYIKDSQTVVLVFDEPLDSITAANVSGYHFTNTGNTIIKAIPVGPSFEEIELTMNAAM